MKLHHLKIFFATDFDVTDTEDRMCRMKKTVVIVIYTMMIGQGLMTELEKLGEYDVILTDDYDNAELSVRAAIPSLLIIEVPNHSLHSLSECLEIGDRFAEMFPGCRSLLLLSYTYMDLLFPGVIEAKRDERIEGFVTTQTRLEEIVATIQSLT